MRSERFDSQVCSYDSHTPGKRGTHRPVHGAALGDVVGEGAVVTSWTQLLGTSVESVLEAHGSNAALATAVKQQPKEALSMQAD